MAGEGAQVRLVGPRVVVRAGVDADVAALVRIRGEPSVRRWWREPDPPAEVAAGLRGGDGERLLVVEVDAVVVGGVQFHEEADPDYRHAGIDIFLATAAQGRGYGVEVVRLVAGYLVGVRGHHRLVIDPAVGNERAIRCYAAVGFRPVGVMREYERDADGGFHDGLLMDLLAKDLAV